MAVALIDYGMGNLHSVAKALERAGATVRRVQSPSELAGCDRLVLPGVGAFRDCVRTLQARGLFSAVLERIEGGTPYLGICLGMQLLMDISLEGGRHLGLGWIAGEVRRFPEAIVHKGAKIPHMGWNDLILRKPHPVLEAVGDRQVYFVHSYFCAPQDERTLLAQSEHGGIRFAAAIARGAAIGVQFHPEKSQAAGIDLLAAFLRWQP